MASSSSSSSAGDAHRVWICDHERVYPELKAVLKAEYGARWNRSLKCWYVSAQSGRAVLEHLRSKKIALELESPESRSSKRAAALWQNLELRFRTRGSASHTSPSPSHTSPSPSRTSLSKPTSSLGESKAPYKELEPEVIEGKLAAGTRVGDVTLVGTRALGFGSFGQVWQGVRDNLERVAVKFIDDQSTSEEGLNPENLAEVEAQQYLRHPNIVPLLAVRWNVVWRRPDNVKRLIVMLMPLEPRDLKRALNELTTLETAAAAGGKSVDPAFARRRLQWAADTFAGLEFLHANEFLHLDVKPPNVLVDAHDVAKLTDFGLVQNVLGQGLDHYPYQLFTWTYRSPGLECGGQRAAKADDWWAYGVLLPEIVFGTPSPFTAAAGSDKNLAGYLSRRVGWPTAFLDDLRAPPGDREDLSDRVTACKMLPVRAQATIQELEELILTPQQRAHWSGPNGHGRLVYDQLWALIHQLLQVDARRRSAAGLRPFFESLHLERKMTPRPALRRPRARDTSVYRRLFPHASEIVCNMAAHIETLLQKDMRHLRTAQQRLPWQVAIAYVAAKLFQERPPSLADDQRLTDEERRESIDTQLRIAIDTEPTVWQDFYE